MLLREFNHDGMQKLIHFLDSLGEGDIASRRMDLLKDEEVSKKVTSEVGLEETSFENRYAAAEYLYDKFADTSIQNLEGRKGIWSWLALFFFKELCPPDSNGNRHPGEKARWIPEVNNWRKYYRHLLAGPYRIYYQHRDDPDKALAVLCTPLHQPGELPEQLASRQELITNQSILAAATKLYYDDEAGVPKRGARGKGPGSVRRFAKVLNQLDLTWDLYEMTDSEILEKLPEEFDKYKNSNNPS